MVAYMINENISVQHIRSFSLPFICHDYYINERLAPIPNQTLYKAVEECLT